MQGEGSCRQEGEGEEEKGGEWHLGEDDGGFLGLSQHLCMVLHYFDFASFLAQK